LAAAFLELHVRRFMLIYINTADRKRVLFAKRVLLEIMENVGREALMLRLYTETLFGVIT
jgi:hypothetical protein